MSKILSSINTNIFKSDADFLETKRKLITEAVGFKAGTLSQQVKTTVIKFAPNKESAFYKPGKESARKKPNIYDMFPAIIVDGKNIADALSFGDIWEYLIKISIIQQDTFKKILVLLYRLCFYIDYQNNRYKLSPEILQEINNIQEFVLNAGFKERFGTKEITLLEFLHFVDLLGWNEDVKYHAKNNTPYFKNFTESKIGRTNTILSIISAPILISQFIQDIIYKTANNGIINVKLITSIIQNFTKSRGLCILSNKELLEYLSPYLTN